MGYFEFTVQQRLIEENSNQILIILKEDAEKILTEILGPPTYQTNWINLEEGLQINLKNSMPLWKEIILYDGNNIQIKINAIPMAFTENNEKIIFYEVQFNSNFKDSSFFSELNQNFQKVKELAKEFNKDPTSETANNLAEQSINTKNMFENYILQTPKTCEEIMNGLFGTEKQKTIQKINIKEYLIHEENDVKTFIKMESCKDCEWKFINLQVRIEQGGIENFQLVNNQELNIEDFKDKDSNYFKEELLSLLRVIDRLVKVENYKATLGARERMQGLNNDIWNSLSNEVTEEITDYFIKNNIDPTKVTDDVWKAQESKIKEEKYIEKFKFFTNLFEGYKSEQSQIEQKTYSQKFIQEFKTSGEEICNNGIDDNSNNKIDCIDELCEGKICGAQEVINSEGELNSLETKTKYCISRICQLKKETIEKREIICGNYLCEEREETTCAQDCKECQTYPPIECSGQVIFKGEDENGCPLEPICIEDKETCSINTQCKQPLCGQAECISGICQTISLNECKEPECNEGQEKIQTCETGEKIITEICSKKIWKKTGQNCQASIGEKIKTTSSKENVCKVKEECGKNYVCENSKCVTIAKTITLQSTSISQTNSIKGVGITGNIINIPTGETVSGKGITGITRTDEIEEIDKVIIEGYRKNKYQGVEGRGSTITGIVEPTTEEEKNLESELKLQKENFIEENQFKKQIESEMNKEEKNVFIAEGICINSQNTEKAFLSFYGGGELGDLMNNLLFKYSSGERFSQSCGENLKELLKEREEIQNSFNQEYIEDFFENTIPQSAGDWKIYSETLTDFYDKIVKNQEKIAYEMDCIGMQRLSEYNLININYNSIYGGILIYEEKLENVKLDGMKNTVTIISPFLEFFIPPSEKSLVQELKQAMEKGELPPSIGSKIERELRKGLTEKETTKIKNNKNLMEKITEISEKYEENIYLNLQITYTNQVIYNLFAKINKKDILKIQAMPEEKTPETNFKIIIPFEKIYKIIYKSEQEKQTKTLTPFWVGENVFKSKVNQLIKNWKDYFTKKDLIDSFQFIPENSDIKSLTEDFVSVLIEEEIKEISKEKTTTMFWTSKGNPIFRIN